MGFSSLIFKPARRPPPLSENTTIAIILVGQCFKRLTLIDFGDASMILSLYSREIVMLYFLQINQNSRKMVLFQPCGAPPWLLELRILSNNSVF